MDDGSLVARGGPGRERELAVAVAVTVHGHVRYKQSTTRHDGSRAHLEEVRQGGTVQVHDRAASGTHLPVLILILILS